MHDEREPAPELPKHLRTVTGAGNWIRALAPVGFALLALAVVVTFVAPSALWFLLYPLLIIGGLWALLTAVSWLLRHL
jgi:hypothetical protein